MKRLARLALVAAIACSPIAACGKKPQPAAPPPATSAPSDRGPTASSDAPGEIPRVTAGGVALDDAPEAVARVAAALATRSGTATRELIALGAEALPTAVELLASKNLAELEAALTFLREITHPDAVQPITRLLSHDAASVRDAARRTIARYDGVGLAAGVIPLLASETPALRIDAARALARIGGDDARDALVKRLTDSDDAVLLEVGAALGAIGLPIPQTAIDALVAEDGRTVQLRVGLILARRLGQRAPTAGIERGLEADDQGLVTDAARAVAAAGDSDRDRLATAVWERGHLDTRRALLEGLVAASSSAARKRAQALARAALTEPDPALRAVAADALGQLIPRDAAAAVGPAAADRAAVPPIDPSDPSDPINPKVHGPLPAPLPALLLPLLDDPSPLVRRVVAARLMSALPHPAVVARLDARLDAEDDEATRQVIVFAIARVATRDALERLARRVDSEGAGPDCHLALMRLSGEQIVRDPALWRAWIDRAFTAGGARPAPTDAPRPAEPKQDAPDAPVEPTPTPRPELTGVPG